MRNRRILNWFGLALITLAATACTLPKVVQNTADPAIPGSYMGSQDTINTAKTQWENYFADPNLVSLIDSALKNNQELNITRQEIAISQSEIRARKGEYLPFLGLRAGAGVEKRGRFTNLGASEATTDIEPGRPTPEPLPDYYFGAFASWELDVWHKLRNAKKAAFTRYLSSVEGKNFMTTNLIAEIANSYFELLALDNQLEIIKQNIEIQNDAFEIVKLQKEATRVTELAVRRFEAQVLGTKSLQYEIQQSIVETENRINFLVGRFPQPITRNAQAFNSVLLDSIAAGVPAQLLVNRPDIRQAELELTAAKLDLKAARANFYPSLGISAGVGYQAFNPALLISTPESIIYSLAGDLTAPLINRNAIKAAYYSAHAKQIQAVYDYQRTILNAYVEVANQLNRIKNLGNSYELKQRQVQALNQSVTISNNLFGSARADYMEVLLTQREALESRFELIEIKKQQLTAMINVYRALGGGWK